MAENRWTAYDSIVSYLTTELNGLVDNANKLGAAIDFATAGADRKLYMDIEIYLGSVDLLASVNPAIYLWVLGRTDGTNFEDGTDSVDPARPPDAIIPLRVFNGVQRVSAKRILTTPDQGKLLIENQSGETLAATANTVKYNLYSEEFV
ncbi:MAG: hypothetical protein KAS66_02785 [Candidatus Omnitrophica bacterium]|nr:hypothetical protein [Candidatus Omnitrophota bacterium]